MNLNFSILPVFFFLEPVPLPVYRLYRVKRRTAEMREKEVNYHKGKSATKIQAFYRMWRQKVVYHRLKRQRETQKDEVKDIGKQVHREQKKYYIIHDPT